MEEQFFSVVRRFVSSPGDILNSAMLSKVLFWSESQRKAAVESLIQEGLVEHAGGHFVRVTEACFDRMCSEINQAAE
jgi:Mn-dependent DtxR family transcriptional regulator